MNATAAAAAAAVEDVVASAQAWMESALSYPWPEPLIKLSSIVLPYSPLSTSSVPAPPTSVVKAVAASSHELLTPIIDLVHKHHTRDTSHLLYEVEPLVAALAIFFCRLVIITGSMTSSPDGHTSVIGSNKLEFVLRLCMAIVLACMAYAGMNYDLICAVHLWSHALPALVGLCVSLFGDTPKKDEGKKKKKKKSQQQPAATPPSITLSMAMATLILLTPPLCLYLCRLFSNPTFLTTLTQHYIPTPMKDAAHYMFPLHELAASYEIVNHFMTDKVLLHAMLAHLLFVTFHIQMGLGHIGIAFLTSEQRRKNMLIRMDVDSEKEAGSNKKGSKKSGSGGDGKQKVDISRKFRRSAPGFILLTVLPYMFQIILFGNLNKFAFINVQNQIHRSVRIHELFDHDSHLTALASDSATSPDVYAGSMDTVVATAYDMFNRKLFSLPKLIILPGVIARQPMLLLKIFPFIFLTDMLKGRIVASVTDRVEQFQREARDVNSVRQKVEQFDMKNAELLRRSGVGATKFTQRRWDELTLEYQAKMAAGDLLKRTRTFFTWLQRNFVFVVLIDCALSRLMAEGSIVVAEIFVFSRAIEDVVDLLLIRSRSESELATLMSEVDKLKVLDEVWSKSKEARLLPCRIGNAMIGDNNNDGTAASSHEGGIVLNNLQYSRGTASVSMDHLVIEPGIYAVTGANGSGKSTLFRLLMACNTNERPIDLHESIELATPLHQWDLTDKLILPDDSCKVPDEGCDVVEKGDDSESVVSLDDNASEEIPVTSITLPSSDIEEISQTFYWPLYSKPIDWIYQKHISDLSETDRKEYILRVAELLQSLSFAQAQVDAEVEADGVENKSNETAVTKSSDVIEKLMLELQEEKEDWFSELSGGQKSKVEVVRKVLLRDECPSVLLVDETMAPLDPASKSQVMSKLKAFCKDSVVLVIYHTDVGRGPASDTDSEDEECVPSNSFFDHNLHVENKHLTNRPVC